MELQIIKQFVDEMSANSSTNAKKDILRKYKDNPFLVKILQYTYHPFKQYYVTTKSIEKRIGAANRNETLVYSDIFSLLDALTQRVVTGHDAIDAIEAYAKQDESTRDIVYQIVEKNLKTRATETIINEIIPNCIPVFEVQLAEKYDEYMEKVEKAKLKAKKGKQPTYVFDLINEDWYESVKLDGCRDLAIVDNAGICRFFSRSGKEFHTLGKVKQEIESFGLKNVVFDGEICLRTADNTDDFQGVMKEIQRKDHTIENPLYYFFDFMPLEVFLDPTSDKNEKFSKRLEKLREVCQQNTQTYTAYLPQTIVRSLEQIEERKGLAIKSGREGLMVKRDTLYQQGRTNDLLKVKLFFDAEYTVVSTENEMQRIIKDNAEIEEMLMKNVQIIHKGSSVDVGSGWTQDERREYYNHPENIIGKVITVRYQMESVDQHGKPSLRFPTVAVVHGDERTI